MFQLLLTFCLQANRFVLNDISITDLIDFYWCKLFDRFQYISRYGQLVYRWAKKRVILKRKNHDAKLKLREIHHALEKTDEIILQNIIFFLIYSYHFAVEFLRDSRQISIMSEIFFITFKDFRIVTFDVALEKSTTISKQYRLTFHRLNKHASSCERVDK